MNTARRPSPPGLTLERFPGSEERARWLERYGRSGLTQSAFAQAQGLSLSRLRYWLYSGGPAAATANPAPRVQEIHLDGWSATSPWKAEVSLPDGRTVRLDAQLARELIGPLLAKS